MSLTFRYKLKAIGKPAISLGGRWVRPRPNIAVTLVGPSHSCICSALLDSGADETVFPGRFAAMIGIDLSNAPLGQITGIGGAVIDVRYAQITLRLSDGIEF